MVGKFLSLGEELRAVRSGTVSIPEARPIWSGFKYPIISELCVHRSAALAGQLPICHRRARTHFAEAGRRAK